MLSYKSPFVKSRGEPRHRAMNRSRRVRLTDGQRRLLAVKGKAARAFTHSCATTRKGGFTVLRRTMRTRFQAKLKAVKLELRRRWQQPLAEQGAYVNYLPVQVHGSKFTV
jgi:hypothetical protein